MVNPPADLVASAISGARQSAEALLELVWPDAFRLARAVLGDDALAEDAAQEACARALVRMTSLKDPAHFARWFYRIAMNEAVTQYRKRKRDWLTFLPADECAELIAPEDHTDVRVAISSLPPQLRAIVLLFYYADLPTADIANIVGISPVAVRLRLMLARRRLRPLLIEETRVYSHE